MRWINESSRKAQKTPDPRTSGKVVRRFPNSARSDELFERIEQFREQMGLGIPRKNAALNILAQTYGETSEFPRVEENGKYVIISQAYFKEEFLEETVDQLLERWVHDSGKRMVLLAPANYGSVMIVAPDPDDDCRAKSVAVVLMAYIFR